MNLEPVESISVRLRKAMSFRNMKQVDLVEKTKIPKSSINQYLSGYAEPKHDRIYQLSVALEVDPVWLMGMDVPMIKKKVERNKESADVLVDIMNDKRFYSYILKISKLSAEKKETLYSYIDFLNSSNH